jgi:hypothetical protein
MKCTWGPGEIPRKTLSKPCLPSSSTQGPQDAPGWPPGFGMISHRPELLRPAAARQPPLVGSDQQGPVPTSEGEKNRLREITYFWNGRTVTGCPGCHSLGKQRLMISDRPGEGPWSPQKRPKRRQRRFTHREPRPRQGPLRAPRIAPGANRPSCPPWRPAAPRRPQEAPRRHEAGPPCPRPP